MTRISWLHLSDMHISAASSFDQNIVHDAFIDDLERQLEKRDIQLQFVFFTGDVASSASLEDYQLAEVFFQKLCDRIKFDKRYLFIVPGNHDVNRYKVSKLLDDNRRDFCTREQIKEIVDNTPIFNIYLSRFDNYSRFISRLYGTEYHMDSTNYYFSEKRQIGGRKYGVIGLNSAWSSYGGRHDCNNIYFSDKQLSDAIEKVKDCSIKIVLLHHPLSWIYEEDRVDIESLLYRHCDIILHGHLHRPDFQVINSLRGQQIIIPAGAIYTGRRVSNSYNITSLDSVAGKFSIIPRRYYEGPRKFLNDIDKYSIGMDEWIHRFNSLHQTESNYPPYNVVKESNTATRVEIALAGFKKKEISVYTENNKLFVEGQKDSTEDGEYLHQGLAKRSFTRVWTISDDVEVTGVEFDDGLLVIKLTRIIPEHQKKKVWF